MAKWEVLLAGRDEVGALTKKAGDIIAIEAYPHSWGVEELKRYLVIIIDGLTEEQTIQLVSPLFTDGKYLYELSEEDTPIVLGKRRSNVDMALLKADFLPSLDLLRVCDITDPYQPFKDGAIELDCTKDKDLIFDKYTSTYTKMKLK